MNIPDVFCGTTHRPLLFLPETCFFFFVYSHRLITVCLGVLMRSQLQLVRADGH